MTGDAVDARVLEQLKAILRRDLKLGPTANIADDMPLIGGELDLDSLDILLLVSSVEKAFAIRIPNEAVGRSMFQDVSTLARFITGAVGKRADSTGAAVSAAGPSTAGADHVALLPHGLGFRFVTRALEVEPGVRAVGHWVVDGSEPFFAHHFPGNPLVPGVLLIESLAQIAGIAMASSTKTKGGMLVGADVRFEVPVPPPATIELAAVAGRQVGTLHQCEVTATVCGNVVASWTVTLRLG